MTAKLPLLASCGLVAAALIALTSPVLAQTTELFLSKTYDESFTVTFDNAVNIDVNKEVDVTKDVNYVGTLVLGGSIDVTEAALSLIDDTQIVNDNLVDIIEGDSTLTNIAVVDGTVLNAASGNIALNSAVGDAILQENIGNLAAIGPAAASAADAEVFSIQKSINNQFDDGTAEVDVLNQVQLLGDVLGAASGNAAVNIAAGGFNVQKNALALAAVTGPAILAETTAAVLQEATFNITFHNQTINEIRLGDAVAATFTGNIALNLSAGTNLVQLNSLTIASAQ